MLTKHKYERIPENWDAETILECCGTNPDDPTCVECCYDIWQKELKTVTQSYAQALEEAEQKQNKWNFIYARRSTYKTWVDELDKAESLARDICYQLEIIALQADKIWYNACKAVEAIEILFCMIRDYFMQIDLLKSIYDDLQNCITKNNDSSLVKGQGILKYLDEYKQKLDAVIKTRDDIIKSITDAIKLANLITNYISTKDCWQEGEGTYDPCAPGQKPCSSYGTEGVAYYGFKTVICEWYNAFECDEPCGEANQDQNNQQQQQQEQQQQHHHHHHHGGGNHHDDECEDEEECELLPTFEFPICNNNYKNCVEQWLTKDEAALDDLSIKLQDAKKKKEALSACKTSLDNAIKAVDPKERCK